MGLFVGIVWGVNSAVECHLHTVEVTGSNPVRPILTVLSGCFFLPRKWQILPSPPLERTVIGE